MALTDTQARKARPGAKPWKMYDGGGLFLQVQPNGGKWWRFRYRRHGKHKLLSVGTYPAVTLKAARAKREEMRRHLAEGVDPAEARKAHKRALAGADSFESVAREWHGARSPTWAPNTVEQTRRRMEREVFPALGGRPVADITAPELLSVLRRIEARGAAHTAHRVLQICSQVFRYAIATGRAERDPAADLRGALAGTKTQHYGSITEPKAIGELLRAIEGYAGSRVTRCALRLAPLVFLRPGELRRAEWAHIDLEAAEWRIPAEAMKMRTPHIVPLSRQAVAVLRELYAFSGAGRYAMPSLRTGERPMSENTVSAALRGMGYTKEEMTGHGFRSMASTRLHELGWPSDVIERQLAHAERNSIKAAYNYAEHLPERRRMMQAWADYLDALRDGAPVVPLHATGAGA